MWLFVLAFVCWAAPFASAFAFAPLTPSAPLRSHHPIWRRVCVPSFTRTSHPPAAMSELLVAVVGSRGLIEERVPAYAELLTENGSATGRRERRKERGKGEERTTQKEERVTLCRADARRRLLLRLSVCLSSVFSSSSRTRWSCRRRRRSCCWDRERQMSAHSCPDRAWVSARRDSA